MPTVFPPLASTPLWFFDNLAHVLIDGEQSSDAYSLVELSAAKGDMPPLHVHHRDDETFYVLEGEMTLFVGDRQIAVSASQAALAPREVPHTYRVESEQARWLVINAPSGFEQFVRTAGESAPSAQLPPPGRPVDPSALAQTAAEHGLEILGPPGMLPAAQRS
ncbi:MAG: quercetin 2,3-dioxygenase [Solirubrobacteraceae bacterium]